jgi:hypothetical protein
VSQRTPRILTLAFKWVWPPSIAGPVEDRVLGVALEVLRPGVADTVGDLHPGVAVTDEGLHPGVTVADEGLHPGVAVADEDLRPRSKHVDNNLLAVYDIRFCKMLFDEWMTELNKCVANRFSQPRVPSNDNNEFTESTRRSQTNESDF